MIKILLIESQKIIRQGLATLIEAEKDLRLVAELAKLEQDDLNISDDLQVILIEQPQELDEFLRAIKFIKDKFPHIKIIAISDKDDDINSLKKMLEAGICGYLTKNASREELYHSVRKVMDDGLYLCTAFAMRMLRKEDHAKVSRTAVTISEPEQQVLNLIADGLTNREIADKLFASVRTIESRRKQLLEKTATTNTATLIKFAVQTGMIV